MAGNKENEEAIALRYDEIRRPSFGFYHVLGPGSFSRIHNADVSIEGPIGKEERYVIFETNPPLHINDPVETSPKRDKAIQIAYEKELDIGRALAESITDHRLPFVDETGMAKPQSGELEKIAGGKKNG
jgi:hypothetical protein